MALSPMMEHYLKVKEQYKDCVIFYRLGDFYEMFFDDAVRVSKLLDLTLTGRDCGLEERAPMCGVPYHAAETYISKLVSLGEKVAICEQLSDPKEAGRGMVERDVIRVVSAGTLIEDGLLDERKNNYIACAVRRSGQYALAWADITTGECCASCRGGQRGAPCRTLSISPSPRSSATTSSSSTSRRAKRWSAISCPPFPAISRGRLRLRFGREEPQGAAPCGVAGGAGARRKARRRHRGGGAPRVPARDAEARPLQRQPPDPFRERGLYDARSRRRPQPGDL